MAELMRCCGCFSIAPSWKGNFGVFLYATGRRIGSCGLHLHCYHLDVQKQALEDLLPKSTGWGNRLETSRPNCPRLRRYPMPCSDLNDVDLDGVFVDITYTPSAEDKTRGTLLSDNPMWVDSLPAPCFERSQNAVQGSCHARSCGPGEELERLCSEGNLDRALNVLRRMDQQGNVPSVAAYKCVLKACAGKKALTQARQAHAHLAKHGLESTRSLGEYLVMTLVKCGGLEDALQVFHRLPNRTVFSWTAVILGHTSAGQGHQALRMYSCMREEGLQPDKYTFVSLLKACSSIANLEEGKRIHAEVLKYRLGTDLFVGTCLVDMYAKCGSTVDAKTVFDGLSQRDVVSWTSMLAAYAQQGQAEEALQLFEQMHHEGMRPSSRTFVSMLQACGMLGEKERDVIVDGSSIKVESLTKGKAMHAAAWRKGHDADVFVGNCLVSMYGKCGSLVDAQIVFNGLSHHDVVSWTAMLTACVQQKQPEKALHLYQQMLETGSSPNDRTLVAALQACGLLADMGDVQSIRLTCMGIGRAIHAESQRKQHDSDAFVANTLVSMYGKCGSIGDAVIVFDGLSHLEVVSWTAMLAAYVEQGLAEEALQLYENMVVDGVSPNDRTFVSVLQACGIIAEEDEDASANAEGVKTKCLEKGKAIHAAAVRKACDSDVFVGNTLVSMYGRCGSIVDAQIVFDGLSERDVVSWNVMITAYAEQGQGDKALQLYKKMRQEHMIPNELTIVSVLQACSSTGSLDVCRQIHQGLVSVQHLSPLLASTLIHAFGRCASMVDAQGVFDALPQPNINVVSWNALLAGYSREGNTAASLQLYEEMQEMGVKPNGVTLISLLSACSHAGLVDKGVEYFETMSKGHGITPDIEHYVGMVDILGRAGLFIEIEAVLSTMPVQPNLSLWLCLLGACRKHGKVVLGRRAFRAAVHLQPNNAAAYVLMSNIYADAGMWDCAREVTALEQEAGAWKKPPGQSWIEHEQELHSFVVEDRRHPQQEQVYELVGKVS